MSIKINRIIFIDKQTFHSRLFNALEVIGYAAASCEGMDLIRGDADEKHYEILSRGVFGLLAVTINSIYDEVEELESDFASTYGAKYPCQMDDEEIKKWKSMRNRWF